MDVTVLEEWGACQAAAIDHLLGALLSVDSLVAHNYKTLSLLRT